MSLDDFIRILRCDGAIAYALVGLVFFSVACEVTSRIRSWDGYLSRFWFVIYGAAGFLLGGAIYLLTRGHCAASAPVVAVLSPLPL
ncbi:protein of unknown function [Shinella sp. WSC3-e]|nr:protein of unknown function [Shinella sp. WSC3-e]